METKNLVVFHNPRCSKSRNVVSELESRKEDFSVFEYLKEDLSIDLLEEVLGKLKMNPEDVLRRGEADYKAFVKGKNLSREELIQKMIDYPKLIERPIIIKGNRAVIGRPLENINDLL